MQLQIYAEMVLKIFEVSIWEGGGGWSRKPPQIRPCAVALVQLHGGYDSISTRLRFDGRSTACQMSLRSQTKPASRSHADLFITCAMRSIARLCYSNVSVCLSVCLSVRPSVCHSRYCIKTTKPISKLFRPSFELLWPLRRYQIPSAGALNTGGVGKFGDVYLGNGAR